MSIVRTEKRERTVAGKLIKWIFVGFNLLMAFWVIGGLSSVSNIQTHSAAEEVGRGIGATIGITLILILWALGDLILGVLVLVTRGDKVIIEESSSNFNHAPQGLPSDSTFDMGKVDQRIAEMKAEASRASAPPLDAVRPQAGFGKRRA
jgi:hypothetical protein